ncbi:hypothetical protein [Arcanobacterium ihumii]|uniref:hypothetical protein n=1 Tax=Arcanobacterium ihumii TaxID=2138162 RepID=UPI000F530F4A|nr:hypothetical protein [Arcanobacterium ihumii]
MSEYLSIDVGERLAGICVRLMLRRIYQVTTNENDLCGEGRDGEYLCVETFLRQALIAIESGEFSVANSSLKEIRTIIECRTGDPWLDCESLDELMRFVGGLQVGIVDREAGLSVWFHETHYWRTNEVFESPYVFSLPKNAYLKMLLSIVLLVAGTLCPVFNLGSRSIAPAMGWFVFFYLSAGSLGLLKVSMRGVFSCSLLLAISTWFFVRVFPAVDASYQFSMVAGLIAGGFLFDQVVRLSRMRWLKKFSPLTRLWVKKKGVHSFEVVIEDENFNLVKRFEIARLSNYFDLFLSYELSSRLDTAVENVQMNGEENWFQVYPLLVAPRMSEGNYVIPYTWDESQRATKGIESVDFENYFARYDLRLLPEFVRKYSV